MQKNTKNVWSAVLYIILFISLFIFIQSISLLGSGYVFNLLSGNGKVHNVIPNNSGECVAVSAVLSSLMTIVLFVAMRWAPVSRNYLRSRPWGVFVWAALLALGSILPTEYLVEKINLTMPDTTRMMFEDVMKVSWGYVAIGLMVPIAEEIVFRGAIQHTLQVVLGKRYPWIAIVISALIFGFIHFNLAQGVHAFVIGLFLGWMYYRTGSILPGFVFHWVNNSVAYLMFNLLPEMNDGKLIDFFHGDDRMMYGGLFFSLCIFVPSLLQLMRRMTSGQR